MKYYFALASLGVLVSQTTAHFVVGRLMVAGFPQYGACPIDILNCDCYRHGQRKGRVVLPDGRFFIHDSFRVEGLCGASRLEFNKLNDNPWSIHRFEGGGGQEVGFCQPRDFVTECLVDRIGWVNELVCTSPICA